jgi:hypothetical protein
MYIEIRQRTNNDKCKVTMEVHDGCLIDELIDLQHSNEIQKFIENEVLPQANTTFMEYDEEDYNNEDYYLTEVFLINEKEDRFHIYSFTTQI